MPRACTRLSAFLLLLPACGPQSAFEIPPEAAGIALTPAGEGFVASNQGLDAWFGVDGARFHLADGASFALATPVEARATRFAACDPLGGCDGTLFLETDGWTETWTSRPDGFEHTFRVTAPTGGPDLAFDIVVEGASVVLTDPRGVRLTPEGSDAVFSYADLAAWDANGTPLEAWFSLDDDAIVLHVDDVGAAYPVFVDPLLSAASWTAEANKASMHTGSAIADVGDLNSDGKQDMAVTAKDYANGQANEGRAWIFYGSTLRPAASATWKVESDQVGAYYGNDVASAGDLNGDGYDDVIVGAWSYDDGQADEGAAFVYLGASTGLSTSATVLEANQVSAGMGWSVVGIGDVNNDGYDDVAVGAFKYDDGQTDEGVVFVYHGSASGLSTTPTTTLSANQTYAWFGYALAGGDVNDDGYDDLLVGAPRYGNGQALEGRAFLYLGSAAGLSTTPAWTSESDQAGAYHGNAVAVGDVTGDGYDDVVIGALYYDNGEINEGRVAVWEGSASGPGATALRTVEANQAGALFGETITLGNVYVDAFADLLVGASRADQTLTDEGAARLYLGTRNGPARAAAWDAWGAQTSAWLGTAVATVWNAAEGTASLVVSAPYYDNGSTDEGKVFYFYGDTITTGDIDGDGSPTGTDPDDYDEDITPEVCDGLDNDGNTLIDDGISCSPCDTWDPTLAAMEADVLTAVNVARAAGHDCYEGYYEPAPALVMSDMLQCAARLHSKDMGDNDFLSHEGSTGSILPERVEAQGYTTWTDLSENVAGGYVTASEAVQGWLDSTSGHCGNLMNPVFVDLGVGAYYAEGTTYGWYWTQVFGTTL